MKVLILEDQTNTCLFLEQSILYIYPNAKIIQFNKYSNTITALENNNIDLIISDLDFDGAKEFALVEQAHKRGIPCIIYTAHYNQSYIDKAKVYKFNAFICKLGKIEELDYALANYKKLNLHVCNFIKERKILKQNSIIEPILNGIETTIIHQLIKGISRKEIAKNLNIKTSTVYSYIRDVANKNNCTLYELIHRVIIWQKEK
ncbi:MAG: Response regulator receiver domain [Bacteroidota bacterium]|jgi:DNA-binding NarL/FixJ family response regulator